MPTYAIGDIQGCYTALQKLLEHIHFDPRKDKLWFAGDVINRGPQSLEVVRFIRNLNPSPVFVLGNHELSFLASAAGVRPLSSQDTLTALLAAPELSEICEWLRAQPLLHHDSDLGFTLIHAGLPPQWDLTQAMHCAKEVEAVLRGESAVEFYQHMYGNAPEQWREELTGWDRLRFITNCFTRIRFCDAEGRLDLKSKGLPGSQPAGVMPWFKVPGRKTQNAKLVFGHWAALMGKAETPNVYALDTGCVWGHQLSALRLEDEQWFRVACPPSSSL